MGSSVAVGLGFLGLPQGVPGSGSPYHSPELEAAHKPLAPCPPGPDLAPTYPPKEQEGAAVHSGGLRSEWEVLASSQPLLFMLG